MKIVSIVGARPQFIKSWPVSKALRPAAREILVHTGQHYDYRMSALFFQELSLPKPDYHLEIGSGPHGFQTGRMLERIEQILIREAPDWVVVYGDTNSTLAGALAAAKLRLKLTHIEAGLRSFNRAMPEEINRILTDHVSDLLFCPSPKAREHLASEGIAGEAHIVGDIMADALRLALDRNQKRTSAVERLGLEGNSYLLMTIHRAENTDCIGNLQGILRAVADIPGPVVFPVHPRTRKTLEALHYEPPDNARLIEPLGYLDMIAVEQSARIILTDSGGIQKEAYWLGVPCITLRSETEWVETVETGWNTTAGADPDKIIQAVRHAEPPGLHPPLYGDGTAALKIRDILFENKHAFQHASEEPSWEKHNSIRLNI